MSWCRDPAEEIARAWTRGWEIHQACWFRLGVTIPDTVKGGPRGGLVAKGSRLPSAIELCRLAFHRPGYSFCEFALCLYIQSTLNHCH